MTRKIILIFCTVLIYQIIQSCCRDREIHYYNWIDITSKNIDNSNAEPAISLNDSILKEAFGIELHILPQTEDLYTEANWSLIKSTYANQCTELFKANSGISEIKVISLNEFDNNHTDSTDITEYFMARDSYDYDELYENIYDYKTKLNKRIRRDRSYNCDPHFDLYLMQAPTSGGLYHFMIEISFYDQQPLYHTVVVNLI